MNICAFSGASKPFTEDLEVTMLQFGKWCADAGHLTICGGMAFGGMKTIGRGVLIHGGLLHAITPAEYQAYEIENTPDHLGLTREITTDLTQRLAAMIAQADAFVAFPGGLGTIHEIMQVWADNQAQTYHRGSARKVKPMIIYNYAGFFDLLYQQMDMAAGMGYIKPEHLQLVTWANTEEELFTALNAL